MEEKKSGVFISMVAMLLVGAGLCVGAYYMLKGSMIFGEELADSTHSVRTRGPGSIVGLLALGGIASGLAGLALIYFTLKYTFNIIRSGGNWEGNNS